VLKIEVDDDGYQLVGPGGEESGVADYGDTAEIECGGVLHFTTVDSAEEAEDAQIYRMVDGHPELVEEDHEVEEWEFVLETEEEDEGDEDEAVPA
jgi:hypothetical protein